MLNTEKQREVVASGLKKYLGCSVIRTNQTMQMPDFPYLGYNITTLATENNGTFGVYEDGKARKPVLQTWSFTARSDDYTEAVEIANNARTWLDYVGTQYLNDNEVIVESVGVATDRSNLLTSDYVYAFGFDCQFWMYDEIEQPETEYIERADISNGTINANSGKSRTYLLRFEDGTELPAVEVGEAVIFDATANDIRAGKTAATGDGVTVGTKDIPAYHTTEGWEGIPAGGDCKIIIRTADRYNYTKLQAIICPFNQSVAQSVAAEKVAIENNVYAAGSTDALSAVSLDHEAKTIVLGIRNENEIPCIIRYFTYKEEY